MLLGGGGLYKTCSGWKVAGVYRSVEEPSFGTCPAVATARDEGLPPNRSSRALLDEREETFNEVHEREG